MSLYKAGLSDVTRPERLVVGAASEKQMPNWVTPLLVTVVGGLVVFAVTRAADKRTPALPSSARAEQGLVRQLREKGIGWT